MWNELRFSGGGSCKGSDVQSGWKRKWGDGNRQVSGSLGVRRRKWSWGERLLIAAHQGRTEELLLSGMSCWKAFYIVMVNCVFVCLLTPAADLRTFGNQNEISFFDQEFSAHTYTGMMSMHKFPKKKKDVKKKNIYFFLYLSPNLTCQMKQFPNPFDLFYLSTW